jgi:hypothetical protein
MRHAMDAVKLLQNGPELSSLVLSENERICVHATFPWVIASKASGAPKQTPVFHQHCISERIR